MDRDAIQELARRVAALDGEQARSAVEQALRQWPTSPELLFLRGSLFAEDRDYVRALEDFQSATDRAPGFAIARFQQGLLLLCLGQAEAARQIWAPLDALEQGNCLRLFKDGLCLLADNQLERAVARLREGQASNTSYPPLNRDMQILIERALDRVAASGPDTEQELHVLLAGYLDRSTRH